MSLYTSEHERVIMSLSSITAMVIVCRKLEHTFKIACLIPYIPTIDESTISVVFIIFNQVN